MEDPKAEVAAGSVEGGSLEARFLELAKESSLDEDSVKKAADLFKESGPVGRISFFGSGSEDEAERYWMPCALYCVAKLGDAKQNLESGRMGFDLSQIFRAAKVNVADFFREIPQFLIKACHALNRMYGSDWEKRLEVKEAQTNLVHLRVLSNYYRRAFEEFFLSSDMSNQNLNGHCPSSINFALISQYHQFGWLLFLALRIHAFSRFRDLVTCTNGLVSILAILILHVPIRFRKFHVLDCTRLAKRSDKGLELLASLCDIYQSSEDDLKAAMDKTNKLIADILKKKPCPASECHADSLAGINTAGMLYFEGLMDGSSLQSSLLMLEKDYVDTTRARGELDERMFVSNEDSLIGSGSPSVVEFNQCSSKTTRSKISPPSSPKSPANGNIIGNNNITVTPTPVSAAMTTAKWLRTIISPLPSKPTAELEKLLSYSDKDITRDILCRANIILDAIFPSGTCGDRSVPGTLQSASLVDQIWIDQRKMESLKLYYRVLEAICRAETQMLQVKNLAPLLSNEQFHRCMLACSAELVLATHKTVTMMFPAILERAGITSFDLCKVIESFVRYEETLPRELKRHLNSLEERLLESMAWERGSSMYNSLVVARPSLSDIINRMGLQAEPMPSLDAISTHQNAYYWSSPKNGLQRFDASPGGNVDMRSPKRLCTGLRNILAEHTTFTSPVKDRLLGLNSPKTRLAPLQSAFATPTRQNPSKGGETCAETEISIFYSKIIKLAASRIKSLCEKLRLLHQIMDRVYHLFQQILNQQTSLFFNRHIDQLILCCFYGVAKISQLTLTFKEIINGYKKQTHCKPQVFRSVFVDWSQINYNVKSGEEHVDIITFYNTVFIPSVKSLLVEIGSAGSASSNQCREENNNVNGSPQLSPFPSLPDMSPKKVSATHNVYVSPLRSSKMDALLSPSSKSFYACIGESTHEYESPSKDLNAINNCLNGGRRMRLNFDVVSDSLVASALSSQNGNSDKASARVISPDRPPSARKTSPGI